MSRSVAFFRNLNLGQGWAPTRPALVAAFEAAGARDVVNHRSNGTVVYSAPAPVRTARAVRAALRDQTGFDDLVVVRSRSWVLDLAGRLERMRLDADASTEVVLYDARSPLPFPVPWSEGRLSILAADHRHAVTSWRRVDARGSTAGPTLYRLTGVRGTARGTDTMLRLLDRL